MSAILTDPIASALNGTDRTLWLTVYHKRIGSYRSSIRREAMPPTALTDGLAATLDEADEVFSRLLHSLMNHLQEEDYDDDDAATSGALSAKTVARRFLALLGKPPHDEPAPAPALRAACARCLVYLGDVARYRQMHLRPPPQEPRPPLGPPPELLGVAHAEWRAAARCYHRALLVSIAQASAPAPAVPPATPALPAAISSAGLDQERLPVAAQAQ